MRTGEMRPSRYYDLVVDVVEQLVKFTLPTRGRTHYLVDGYSERNGDEVVPALARAAGDHSYVTLSVCAAERCADAASA